MFQIWSKEAFVINKAKKTVLLTYVIIYLKGEEIVGTFYEKELQKKRKKQEFRVEKLIKEGDKLYVKWKDYNISFNSPIDKKNSINEWIFSRTKLFRRKRKS